MSLTPFLSLREPGYYVNVCARHFSTGRPTKACPNPDQHLDMDRAAKRTPPANAGSPPKASKLLQALQQPLKKDSNHHHYHSSDVMRNMLNAKCSGASSPGGGSVASTTSTASSSPSSTAAELSPLVLSTQPPPAISNFLSSLLRSDAAVLPPVATMLPKNPVDVASLNGGPAHQQRTTTTTAHIALAAAANNNNCGGISLLAPITIKIAPPSSCAPTTGGIDCMLATPTEDKWAEADDLGLFSSSDSGPFRLPSPSPPLSVQTESALLDPLEDPCLGQGLPLGGRGQCWQAILSLCRRLGRGAQVAGRINLIGTKGCLLLNNDDQYGAARNKHTQPQTTLN